MTRTSSPSFIEFGRIGDDALVLIEPPGDFDLGSKVAHDTHIFQYYTVVRAHRSNPWLGIAIEHCARGNGENVGVRRDLKMDSRECARLKQSILVVGKQFDQQGARFLVDRV